MSRVIVYAERTVKYEIEVEPTDTGRAIALARNSIESGGRDGVLSYWSAEEPLDFDVEVIE